MPNLDLRNGRIAGKPPEPGFVSCKQVVIINTLSRMFSRTDQMDAADMTLLPGSLQHLASRHDICV